MIAHNEEDELELVIREDEILFLIITRNKIKKNEQQHDNNEHGYGLKNVKSIVEQYFGTVNINSCF